MAFENESSLFSRIQRGAEIACGIILFIAVTISMAEIVMRVVFKMSFDLFFDLPVWLTVWALAADHRFSAARGRTCIH